MIYIMNGKKWKLIVCLLVGLGILLGSAYRISSRETKADRSNAMQVVKTLDPEISAKVDFFTEYRLERDRLRSQRSEILRESMQCASSDEARQTAQESMIRMVREKEKESEMENLIRAKGFSDALVLCGDRSVSAVVKSAALTQDEATQVADVIARISGVEQENITISAKP